MSELAKWDSFYVIVGSAAGALIGLQFVVMTLVAERPPLRAAEAGAATMTVADHRSLKTWRRMGGRVRLAGQTHPHPALSRERERVWRSAITFCCRTPG